MGEILWRTRQLGCHLLNPLSFSNHSAGDKEGHHGVKDKQEKKGKTNTWGWVEGLFGGFRSLWSDLVIWEWSHVGDFLCQTPSLKLCEVKKQQDRSGEGLQNTWHAGESFSVFIPVIFQDGRVVDEGNSLYTATEPFTPPGDYDEAPLCLQLLWMIRIIH